MKQSLSKKLLEKLQSTYEQVPDRTLPSADEKQFDSGLREFISAYGSDIVLQPGETLFFEDDPADGIYWIESGVVAVLQGDINKPKVLTFRKAEHVVGEIALLENIQRTATVAAISKTHLNYLSKDKFQGLLALIPGFGVELLRLLSARLREVKPAEYSDGLYDHLTGALSRQAFDARLQEEMERTRIYQDDFSLVFLDLDNFKDINDAHGHARGDEVLISFVERIKAHLRTTDLLFRYGGDEFVLILQGVDASRGPGLVQHLLDAVSNMPLPGNPPVTISFSAGVAYFPTDGNTPQLLLKAADQRVYHAKRSGRGRVTGSLPNE